MASEPDTVCFLLECYLYMLSLSSLNGGYHSNDDGMIARDVEFAIHTATTINRPFSGMLLGCAYQLFVVIPYMAPVLSTRDDHPAFRTLDDVTREVQAWEPPWYCSPDWVSAGRLYQLAIKLILYDTITGTEKDPANMEDFVLLLRTIEVDSPITTTLCWPLAVAGLHAYTPAHRTAINEYLTAMFTKYRFGNLLQLRMILYRIWAKNQDTSNITITLRRGDLNSILLI